MPPSRNPISMSPRRARRSTPPIARPRGDAASHLRLFAAHVERARTLGTATEEPLRVELDWLHRGASFHRRCID
jgi:hypothetical protein